VDLALMAGSVAGAIEVEGTGSTILLGLLSVLYVSSAVHGYWEVNRCVDAKATAYALHAEQLALQTKLLKSLVPAPAPAPSAPPEAAPGPAGPSPPVLVPPTPTLPTTPSR
jgi:hypothetical protein